MKVLLVGLESPAWRIGGLNRYLAELAAALDANGVGVTCTMVATNDEASLVAVDPTVGWLRRLHQFSRAIRRSDADVIDVHFAAHASWALASGALRRRRLVVHFQGPWALESRTSGDGSLAVRAKSVLEAFVLRRADAVVTLSSAFRDVAIERYGVSPERIQVIAPGASSPQDVDRDQVRADLGLRGDQRAIVAVRRLVARMGLDRAITAFAEARGDNELLFIIGEGPLKSELQSLAQRLGVSGAVHFLGSVDDDALQRWFLAADVSIVPSVAHEGFGLVVLESLAQGTPVIASELEGLRDAARVSRAVKLIDWSPAALRRAIDELTSDGSMREVARVGGSARSWQLVAREHVDLYHRVVEGLVPRSVVVLDHTARHSGGELAYPCGYKVPIDTIGRMPIVLSMAIATPMKQAAKVSHAYPSLTFSRRWTGRESNSHTLAGTRS